MTKTNKSKGLENEPFNQYIFKWDSSINEYVCISETSYENEKDSKNKKKSIQYKVIPNNELPKSILLRLEHETRLKLETLKRLEELEKAFKKD